jgi:hypothetical protein
MIEVGAGVWSAVFTLMVMVTVVYAEVLKQLTWLNPESLNHTLDTGCEN